MRMRRNIIRAKAAGAMLAWPFVTVGIEVYMLALAARAGARELAGFYVRNTSLPSLRFTYRILWVALIHGHHPFKGGNTQAPPAQRGTGPA